MGAAAVGCLQRGDGHALPCSPLLLQGLLSHSNVYCEGSIATCYSKLGTNSGKILGESQKEQ